VNDQNYVSLKGRLTADPQLRQTPGGVSVTQFAIAVNRRLRNAEGRTFQDHIAWRHSHGPLAIEPGGGESLSDVLRRYCYGFRFVAEQPGSTALVIAHGLPVNVALLAVSGMGETIPVEFPQARAAELHTFDTRQLLKGLIRIERAVDNRNFAGPAPRAARSDA
jgi:broad specificity phosphatase PhoE